MTADTADGDFGMWREELDDRPPPRTVEDMFTGLDRVIYIEGGFTALAEDQPCFYCGRPTRCQDPQGVVRHPTCPMSPEDEEQVRRSEAREAQLRAEQDAARGVGDLLDRLRNPEADGPDS